VALINAASFAPQIAIAAICGAIALLLLIRWCGRSRIASDLLTALPLIGPLWRDRGVAEFADLLGLLVAHSVPLPKAFELTASGLDNGSLAAACRKSSQLAEAGVPLADCVGRVSAFPPSLRPIVSWGDRLSTPDEALASASQWFLTRCDLRSDLLTVVVPPITFLFVTITMIYVMGALFAPLIQLMRSLT
jgi:type IV pilus assembly protein PilC